MVWTLRISSVFIMSSSDWKTYTIVDDIVAFSLCFNQSVKRIDIRLKRQGKFTRYGVSLTPSEVDHCVKFITGVKNNPEFYHLSVEKAAGANFWLKKGTQVLTTSSFWKKVSPFIPAAKYLCGDLKEKDQLFDLFIVSKSTDKNDLLEKKWAISTNPKDCENILEILGLRDNSGIRPIDFEALNKFADEKPEVFTSMVNLFYVNR